MSKGITGMPGPGGSLGQCGVCGKNFMLEIIMGKNVHVCGLEGLKEDFCVHDSCADLLQKVQSAQNWELLPEGPLRKCFENAEHAKEVQP
jgi:hypothetical protein